MNVPYGSTDYMKWAISLNNELENQKEKIFDLEMKIKDKDKEIEDLTNKLNLLDIQTKLLLSRIEKVEEKTNS